MAFRSRSMYSPHHLLISGTLASPTTPRSNIAKALAPQTYLQTLEHCQNAQLLEAEASSSPCNVNLNPVNLCKASP